MRVAWCQAVLATALLLLHSLPPTLAVGRQLQGAREHRYSSEEHVPLWAAKVGPFSNPRSVSISTWEQSMLRGF
jgi:hypothetical protein